MLDIFMSWVGESGLSKHLYKKYGRYMIAVHSDSIGVFVDSADDEWFKMFSIVDSFISDKELHKSITLEDVITFTENIINDVELKKLGNATIEAESLRFLEFNLIK